MNWILRRPDCLVWFHTVREKSARACASARSDGNGVHCGTWSSPIVLAEVRVSKHKYFKYQAIFRRSCKPLDSVPAFYVTDLPTAEFDARDEGEMTYLCIRYGVTE